jgi:membrane protein implicated in regulation of membrane protease activity
MKRRGSSTIFLILGIAFLAIGFATNETIYSWIAIAFVVVAFITSRQWSRKR